MTKEKENIEKKDLEEKESSSETNNGEEKVNEKKVEWQLLKIVGFFTFLVLVFFVSSEIFKEMKEVEYEGLTFTKGKFGEIEAYHYPYYYEKDQRLINYNLFVRNNPAENKIPVEGDKIEFDSKRYVHVTIDSKNLAECEQSILAVADITNFLTGNGIRVESGNMDEEIAERTGNKYVTCENEPDRKVIEIFKGDETKININGNCYEISVNNCEVLQATEKFEVQSLIDAGIGKIQ